MSPKMKKYYKKCCNPLETHKKIITRSVRQISTKCVTKYSDFNLKEGDYICTACLSTMNKKLKKVSSEDNIGENIQSDDSNNGQSQDVIITDLNLQLGNLDVSPIKTCKQFSNSFYY